MKRLIIEILVLGAIFLASMAVGAFTIASVPR